MHVHFFSCFRKLIEKDKGILSKMVTEMTDYKQSLAAQEEIVRKLQRELEAAQKVTLANRMLVSRLQSKTKLAKERIEDKQLAASNFEEELLRAKSILSAVKRKMPIVGDTGSGRNSPQVESSGSVSNENQKFTISSSTAQEIKNSLDAKLSKLSSLTKLENREKRKLEGASESSSEETVSFLTCHLLLMLFTLKLIICDVTSYVICTCIFELHRKDQRKKK